LQVRLRKTGELIGRTDEFRAGTARTLAEGPLQKGEDLLRYDLAVVVHPTTVKGEIYFGYAIMADSLEHAGKLPGFRPFMGGTPDRVIVDTARKRKNKAVAAARAKKAAELAVAAEPDPLG
jgi:hypothetical protein